MDWQQFAALTIVAFAAAAAILTKVRRRRFSFARDTHCGCSSSSNSGRKDSIVFSARKGQRARVIVKMK